jgi:hypothetical protein
MKTKSKRRFFKSADTHTVMLQNGINKKQYVSKTENIFSEL